MDKVAAIIVSYNPHPADLEQLLVRITTQVDKVIMVDNASKEALQATIIAQATTHGAMLLVNNSNLGLAAGQCLAIQAAMAQNMDFTLLLDQDSLPAVDMVACLLKAYHHLIQQGLNIAGVGPVVVLPQLRLPFVSFTFQAALKYPCRNEGSGGVPHINDSSQLLFPTDFLISSGLLIPIGAYKLVGLPEQALFIDNVDLEWCFRTRHHHMQLYGVCAATIQHRLGKQIHFITLFGYKWPIYIHEPVRQYYQTRNRLLLYGRYYVPWTWKLYDIPRLLFKLLYFSLIVPPRLKHLHMMSWAIWDALWGVAGAFAHRE